MLFPQPLSSDTQASEVAQWLQYHRFANYVRVFQNFSGMNQLKSWKDDLDFELITSSFSLI